MSNGKEKSCPFQLLFGSAEDRKCLKEDCLAYDEKAVMPGHLSPTKPYCHAMKHWLE